MIKMALPEPVTPLILEGREPEVRAPKVTVEVSQVHKGLGDPSDFSPSTKKLGAT